MEEARLLLENAVIGLEKTLGSEHLRTLIVISDLASIRLEQRGFNEHLKDWRRYLEKSIQIH